MCLIAFAIHASARWPLVIAANRDEFLDRPALPLARWQSASGQTIVSGRDVRAGGTWLGMTPGGRIALLTNVREAGSSVPAPSQKSRGELVLRWLEGNMDADRFMAQTDDQAYAGFNLVVGDWQTDRWTWLSNRFFDATLEGSATQRPINSGWCSRALTPGVYGLSNAALNTPWPKALALKAAVAGALDAGVQAAHPDAIDTPLWTALASRRRASPETLPDTGLPAALEEALSSAFVDSPERGYGTRCSTLVVASASETVRGERRWAVRVDEKTHSRPTADTHTTSDTPTTRQVLHWQRGGTSH